jgi:hypothetical protein
LASNMSSDNMILCGAMAARLTSNQKVTGSSPVMETAFAVTHHSANTIVRVTLGDGQRKMLVIHSPVLRRDNSSTVAIIGCAMLYSNCPLMSPRKKWLWHDVTPHRSD